MTEKKQNHDRHQYKSAIKRIQQLRAKLPHPKQNKIQTINSFLADPTNINSEEPEKNTSFHLDEQVKEVQPWLEPLQATSQTLKQQQMIRRQINYMLGISDQPDNEGGSVTLDIQKVDPVRINRKLKKYQPTNGSFSLLYGEKKGLQRIKKQDSESRQDSRSLMPLKLNFPPITGQRSSRGQTKHIKSERHQGLIKAASGELISFISQIKEIERFGSVVTNFSDRLIHKIENTNRVIDNKYKQLNQKAMDMLEDIGNYHLQEETDKDYKNNLLNVPAWLLKKK